MYSLRALYPEDTLEMAEMFSLIGAFHFNHLKHGDDKHCRQKLVAPQEAGIAHCMLEVVQSVVVVLDRYGGVD